MTFIALLFLVMFIIPFTKGYPYDLTFTFSHLVQLFKDDILIRTYLQSLFVAFGTAIFGVLISFTSALISVRTNVKGRQSLNLLSIVTNTVPGMVLGLSYLLLFNNSSLKGTLLIIILSNIVHYFTTPYLMAKGALEKLDMSWDVTSTLLEDTWLQTIFRIILPNMKSTIINIFQYYFVNAMVTISGVIFLITSSTMLVSTQINVLQHFNAFNDIFLLSIFIFVTNLVIKMICTFSLEYLKRKEVS
ncbi:ABC transporter permease subunit [Mammaliicoccus lentus]|uniref:ABC transporter permease subunit n=1 Tax=Mammaliicoccus lentus TaxID=42858 RepID=UPI003D0FD6B3